MMSVSSPRELLLISKHGHVRHRGNRTIQEKLESANQTNLRLEELEEDELSRHVQCKLEVSERKPIGMPTDW
ncbi:hypothetical protein RUM44_010234 [Polyplax serrata]|uniref:Uncharacterized protein n=1 Tax=Polyplax serrata TaxID=468196 RepID=A0ABR1AV12_POLSC